MKILGKILPEQSVAVPTFLTSFLFLLLLFSLVATFNQFQNTKSYAAFVDPGAPDTTVTNPDVVPIDTPAPAPQDNTVQPGLGTAGGSAGVDLGIPQDNTQPGISGNAGVSAGPDTSQQVDTTQPGISGNADATVGTDTTGNTDAGITGQTGANVGTGNPVAGTTGGAAGAANAQAGGPVTAVTQTVLSFACAWTGIGCPTYVETTVAPGCTQKFDLFFGSLSFNSPCPDLGTATADVGNKQTGKVPGLAAMLNPTPTPIPSKCFGQSCIFGWGCCEGFSCNGDIIGSCEAPPEIAATPTPLPPVRIGVCFPNSDYNTLDSNDIRCNCDEKCKCPGGNMVAKGWSCGQPTSTPVPPPPNGKYTLPDCTTKCTYTNCTCPKGCAGPGGGAGYGVACGFPTTPTPTPVYQGGQCTVDAEQHLVHSEGNIKCCYKEIKKCVSGFYAPGVNIPENCATTSIGIGSPCVFDWNGTPLIPKTK